jgi:hypothetical protein
LRKTLITTAFGVVGIDFTNNKNGVSVMTKEYESDNKVAGCPGITTGGDVSIFGT